MRLAAIFAWLCTCLMGFAADAGLLEPADVEESSSAALYTLPQAQDELAAAAPSNEDLLARAQWQYLHKNFDDAFALYVQAADKGQAQAQYMAGQMLTQGLGVPLPNDELALRYTAMAAEQGHPQAQLALGMMYYNGTSTLARDAAEAYKWFYLAAMQGQPKAQGMLARVQKDMDTEAPATAQSGR